MLRIRTRDVLEAAGGRGMAFFIACLLLANSAIVGSLIASGARIQALLPALALGCLAYIAERQAIRLSAVTELSVAFLPVVFAAVAFGPLEAMIVGAIGMLRELRPPHLRWLVWTATRAIVASGAGLSAAAVGAPRIESFADPLIAAAAAIATLAVLDTVLGGATVAIRGSASFASVVKNQRPLLVASPIYSPVIGLLVYAYYETSPWSVGLFLLPAFAAQQLYVLYRKQREATEELESANARLARANLSFATALVATLDARDHYTAGHSASVAEYARDIAARMGLSEEEQRLAHVAGLVHDIGKIGLPPGLLEKRGPLTLRERRQMEQHAVIGERILAKMDEYREISTIVRHHHERVDGAGYPDGLSRDEIPLVSRIIAVADAYDAMTSDRPYRDAMPTRVARLRLAQAVESQFDTAVVAAFEAILAGSDEDYRAGRHARMTAPIRATSAAHASSR